MTRGRGMNRHHRTICKLPDFPTICIQGFPGTVGELYNRHPGLLVRSLDSSIGEDTFLFAGVRKDALQGAVRELDLLGPVWEMFLCLIVGEFVDLESVGVGGLGGARIRIEVD
jgi:hypothetical protein